jgi:hypothetical protein
MKFEELNEFIRLVTEAFSQNLIDDKSFKKKSVLVPNKTKNQIKKWIKAMSLAK